MSVSIRSQNECSLWFIEEVIYEKEI